MKKDSRKRTPPLALTVLRQVAREVLEEGRKNNTPVWVMVDGKIVDATKLPVRKTKSTTRRARKSS